MENLVRSRNHKLVKGTYINNTSRFGVYCPIHDRSHNTSLFNYKRSKRGLSCCSKPIIIPRPCETASSVSLSETQQKKQNENTAKAALNGHIIQEGVYQNRFSPLKVLCTKHNKIHETNYYNYNRSLAGLACCKNVARESRGGQTRDWRRSSQARTWRTKVLQAWDNKCAITGKGFSETSLVCHHFFNASRGDNFAYSIINSIVLSEDIHEKFHISYGYTSNTIEQFLDYLLALKNSPPPVKAAESLYDLDRIDSLLSILKDKRNDILLSLDL
jgi:hypothetical protein